MHAIWKPGQSPFEEQRRNEERKKYVFEKQKAKEEAWKVKMGRQDKDAGYSKPGYNFGIGKYVWDKSDFKKKEREAKEEFAAKNKGARLENIG